MFLSVVLTLTSIAACHASGLRGPASGGATKRDLTGSAPATSADVQTACPSYASALADTYGKSTYASVLVSGNFEYASSDDTQAGLVAGGNVTFNDKNTAAAYVIAKGSIKTAPGTNLANFPGGLTPFSTDSRIKSNLDTLISASATLCSVSCAPTVSPTNGTLTISSSSLIANAANVFKISAFDIGAITTWNVPALTGTTTIVLNVIDGTAFQITGTFPSKPKSLVVNACNSQNIYLRGSTSEINLYVTVLAPNSNVGNADVGPTVWGQLVAKSFGGFSQFNNQTGAFAQFNTNGGFAQFNTPGFSGTLCPACPSTATAAPVTSGDSKQNQTTGLTACVNNYTGPQCSSAPFCMMVGLKQGNCCPTETGTILDCCVNVQYPFPGYTGPTNVPAGGGQCPQQKNNPAAPQKPASVTPCVKNYTGPQCSSAPFCMLVGLQNGNCCPTDSGTFLDCCKNVQYPYPGYTGPTSVPPTGVCP